MTDFLGFKTKQKVVAVTVADNDPLSATNFETVFCRMKEATGAGSDTALARSLGLRQGSISSAKDRKQLPAKWLSDLSAAKGISVDWLLYGIGSMRLGETAGAVRETLAPYGCECDQVMVPKVRARLCAGSGSLETSAEVKGHYGFRSDWIHSRGNPGSMVLMEVAGDSMEPELLDGDTVMVDLSQTDIIVGKIYAVAIGDEVVIKRLHRVPGKLVLKSANHIYNDVEVHLDGQLADQVKVLGRVVWWCREA